LHPVDENYGFGRGTPVDRYYIENFLKENSQYIFGTVLEIGDNNYTIRFGGDKVTRSEIFHVNPAHTEATIIDTLEKGDSIPSDTFDCLIVTQTLHLIYNYEDAIKTMFRILKRGGVALVTIPGLSQMADKEWNDSWYWGFTRHSAKRMFDDVFSEENVEVSAFGNVLSSMAFLNGISQEELTKNELDYRDIAYDLNICVNARKK